ncbi:MAG: ornithine carbamoyltransferase [Candidatus Bathyarchaeia archaeon]
MLKGSDFLTLLSVSSEDIWKIIELAVKFKKGLVKGAHRPLKDKTLALIFQKSSTRTRVSLEVAIQRLGGSPLYLNWSDLQLGRGEPVSDTAKVLDRYVDGIVARVYSQSDLNEMAECADVPVINALSDLCHPMQTLADLQTMLEKLGRLEGLKVAYVGDGNNVCNSLMLGCVKMGVNVSVAAPKGFEPDMEHYNASMREAALRGLKLEVVNDPCQAVREADVVYTDVIASMGQEGERSERAKVFLPKYRVTVELMEKAAPHAIFMHPLPCHRGEEVEAEVIDGWKSAVWDQAENRLHTTQALLSLIYQT